MLTTISTEETKPYASLSFVGADGSLWAPVRTDDYSWDCNVGRSYARELIAFMADRNSPMMLGHVCCAMPAKHSGVEIGFFHELATAAGGADRAS